jgi:hypothetical protein
MPIDNQRYGFGILHRDTFSSNQWEVRMKLKRLASIGASLVLLLSVQVPASAKSNTSSQTLIIGVDHLDLANQQPQNGRVFEYTDFFTRAVTVHTGDTLDLQAAPGSFHIVALAADETVARKA